MLNLNLNGAITTMTTETTVPERFPLCRADHFYDLLGSLAVHKPEQLRWRKGERHPGSGKRADGASLGGFGGRGQPANDMRKLAHCHHAGRAAPIITEHPRGE